MQWSHGKCSKKDKGKVGKRRVIERGDETESEIHSFEVPEIVASRNVEYQRPVRAG